MFDYERMNRIVEKINEKREREATQYADALEMITVAYGMVPEFLRKNKISFEIEDGYNASIYTVINSDTGVKSSFIELNKTGICPVTVTLLFATEDGEKIDYREASREAGISMKHSFPETETVIRGILDNPESFIDHLMDRLEMECEQEEA